MANTQFTPIATACGCHTVLVGDVNAPHVRIVFCTKHAATDDLLALLEMVAHRLDMEEHSNPGGNYMLAAMRADIHAAINKARGS